MALVGVATGLAVKKIKSGEYANSKFKHSNIPARIDRKKRSKVAVPFVRTLRTRPAWNQYFVR